MSLVGSFVYIQRGLSVPLHHHTRDNVAWATQYDAIMEIVVFIT